MVQLIGFTLLCALTSAIVGVLYLYLNHDSPFDHRQLGLATMPEIAAAAVNLSGYGLLGGPILWILYKVVQRDFQKF